MYDIYDPIYMYSPYMHIHVSMITYVCVCVCIHYMRSFMEHTTFVSYDVCF